MNTSGPGQPWRNKTRPSITLASSLPSLHCAEPEGLHIKARAAGCRGVPAPDGQRPAHGLPVCTAHTGLASAHCLSPGSKTGMQRCSLLRVRREMPEVTAAAESTKGGGAWMRGHHCSIPGLAAPSLCRGEEEVALHMEEEPVPSQAYPGAAGSLQSKACSCRAAPAILARPFSLQFLPCHTAGASPGLQRQRCCRQYINFWMSFAAPQHFSPSQARTAGMRQCSRGVSASRLVGNIP